MLHLHQEIQLPTYLRSSVCQSGNMSFSESQNGLQPSHDLNL
jgi:hypothetical protein